MAGPEKLDELIDALRCLPGVGPKSAQRMALHLLRRDRAGARTLGNSLLQAMDQIHPCEQCRNYTDQTVCRWCRDPMREQNRLCIVENPADVIAIDRATPYRGLFFLLLGHLSPLDGIGPGDLGIDRLTTRLDSGEVDEITLALNSTVEGQATARYIAELASARGIDVLQIARGLPMGGELEYADGGTLSVAFSQRTRV